MTPRRGKSDNGGAMRNVDPLIDSPVNVSDDEARNARLTIADRALVRHGDTERARVTSRELMDMLGLLPDDAA